MNLSDEVRTLSRKLGIPLSEVARRTNQSPSNLSKKMNRNTLSFEDFEKILQALGIEMEYSFHRPGEANSLTAGFDDRTRAQIEILQKQLETEQLKNSYFTKKGFVLRTELETVTGSLELAKHHRDTPKRLDDCFSRMDAALDNILNLLDNDPISAGRTPAANTGGGFKQGMRVLVVDDNEINRSIVRELLEDSGIQSEEAENGKQAVELVFNAPENYYDLILMDIQMPVMSGLAATEAIRKLNSLNASVPIVAMTAGVGNDERAQAEKSGVNSFIEKPLNMNKLVLLLESVYDR